MPVMTHHSSAVHRRHFAVPVSTVPSHQTMRSALALSPRDFRRERFEAVRPEMSKSLQPGVDILQWSRVQGVDPARAFGANRGKSAFAEYFEVLGNRRLRDFELTLDDRDDFAGGIITNCEQLEDPAPNRISKDIEGMHQSSLGGSGWPV